MIGLVAHGGNLGTVYDIGARAFEQHLMKNVVSFIANKAISVSERNRRRNASN
jgi:hypothetical protein